MCHIPKKENHPRTTWIKWGETHLLLHGHMKIINGQLLDRTQQLSKWSSETNHWKLSVVQLPSGSLLRKVYFTSKTWWLGRLLDEYYNVFSLGKGTHKISGKIRSKGEGFRRRHRILDHHTPPPSPSSPPLLLLLWDPFLKVTEI